MKKLLILPVAALLAVGCQNAGQETTTTVKTDSVQKTEAPAATGAKPDSAAMMKNWTDFMTPGPMQALLGRFAGKWEVENRLGNDTAHMTVIKGSGEIRMIMGGRYQQSNFKGDFNGMPFEGLEYMAYDNGKKVFVNTWIDNMGTGVMILEGTYDSTAKTLTLTGKTTDPSTNKEMNEKIVKHFVDDKHIVTEMFSIGADGKETKSMDMRMTRK